MTTTLDEFNPLLLDLKWTGRNDSGSGLPVYEFLSDYVWFRRDTGDKVSFPRTRKTDGGSIPSWLHWFAQPLEPRGAVSFVRHDEKYTIEGGLRQFTGDAEATASYTRNPITRLRADWELYLDYICAHMYHMLTDFYIAPSIVGAMLLPFSFVWILVKAKIIFVFVRIFGGKAWRSVEADTELALPSE